MSGSGRDAIPDVLVRSGGLPGCQGVVFRPSRMTGSGLETLLDVREVHPDVREVLRDDQKWSGGPPGCGGVVERPSRMNRSGQEVILNDREWS